MSSYKKKFPELYQYLGGLFHQDWKDVFDWKEQKPHFEGVINYFKITNSKCYENEEMKELKMFLALNLSDAEIESIMRKEFNLGIRPAYWNLTHKEWLELILKILEEPMEKTKKEFIPEFIG
jgi:hypothetical protein